MAWTSSGLLLFVINNTGQQGYGNIKEKLFLVHSDMLIQNLVAEICTVFHKHIHTYLHTYIHFQDKDYTVNDGRVYSCLKKIIISSC
jgi:hypothetical protein